jgi:hypothetical protein
VLFSTVLISSCASSYRQSLAAKVTPEKALEKGFVLNERYRHRYPDVVPYIFYNTDSYKVEHDFESDRIVLSKELHVTIQVEFFREYFGRHNVLVVRLRTASGLSLNPDFIKVHSKKLGELELLVGNSTQSIPYDRFQYRYVQYFAMKHRFDGVTQLKNDVVEVKVGSEIFRFVHPESDVLYQ